MSQLLSKLRESQIWRLETFLIGLAIVLASLGAFLQHQYEQKTKEEILSRFQTVNVLAVKSNLKRNTVIKKSHLIIIPVLSQHETSNMLSQTMTDKVIGRSLDIDVIAGDILLFSMISDLNSSHTMAEKIPIGKRLFTLMVETTQGPAGFLRPGDHVDIIAKMDFPEKGTTTFTLLEDIFIVAIDEVTDPSLKTKGKHISFFVNPEEMERLRFAQEEGSFYVSLRNPFDKATMGEKKGVNFGSFILSDRVYESADPSVKVKVKK